MFHYDMTVLYSNFFCMNFFMPKEFCMEKPTFFQLRRYLIFLILCLSFTKEGFFYNF